MKRSYCAVLLLILAACAVQPAGVQETPVLQPSIKPQPTTSQTASPVPTWTREAVPSLTQSPSPAVSSDQTGSPLEGISLAALPEVLTNPFQAPRPGQDDGHHGTDFAFYRYKDRGSILGLGVTAVFPGSIAASIADRPPYGNMMIVETPLEDLPGTVQDHLNSLPPPATPVPGNIRLSCPTLEPINHDRGPMSLYLLYAHLEKAPAWKTGDRVTLGQRIGSVGNSGVSSNPHLHLELRLGPAGSTFKGMAHYTASASPEEMASYCSWRVSGAFWPIDPMSVLSTG